jgi:hypothetical protein
MKYKKLVNFQALSEELTGSKNAIRPERHAKKYAEQLKDLDELLKYWIESTKRRTNK